MRRDPGAPGRSRAGPARARTRPSGSNATSRRARTAAGNATSWPGCRRCSTWRARPTPSPSRLPPRSRRRCWTASRASAARRPLRRRPPGAGRNGPAAGCGSVSRVAGGGCGRGGDPALRCAVLLRGGRGVRPCGSPRRGCHGRGLPAGGARGHAGGPVGEPGCRPARHPCTSSGASRTRAGGSAAARSGSTPTGGRTCGSPRRRSPGDYERIVITRGERGASVLAGGVVY